MTFRRTSSRRAAFTSALGTVLLVAACGATSPTSPAIAPTGSAGSAETPIDVPTFDLGTLALPSFALPSFAPDTELEGLLPDSIGGNVVVKMSFTGGAIANMPGGAAIQDQLDDLDATADDVSVAVGTSGNAPNTVVVFAYRIAGVSADRTFKAFQDALEAGQGGEVRQTTVSGRGVTQVTAGGETTYIYLADDVVFIVGGTLTPELLADAIKQLPAA